MKKLLLLAFALSMFAACGKNTKTPTTPPPTAKMEGAGSADEPKPVKPEAGGATETPDPCAAPH